MERSEIISKIWSTVEPLLTEHGFELVEAEYGPHGHRWLVRLFIDKASGVTIDDCVDVSRLLGPALDSLEEIGEPYTLEISSPGFDRPIRKPADFVRFTGETIRLKAHTPVMGRKAFTGILKGFQDGLVAIECDGTTYEVHIENLQKANLVR